MLVSRISPAPSATTLLRPLHGVQPCRGAPAVRVDLVVRAVPAGVDGDHHALAAELLGGGANEVGVLHRNSVQAHLVRARVQDGADVVQRADAPADGEGDEHLLGRRARRVRTQARVARGWR
jgi:hypothetical protein